MTGSETQTKCQTNKDAGNDKQTKSDTNIGGEIAIRDETYIGDNTHIGGETDVGNETDKVSDLIFSDKSGKWQRMADLVEDRVGHTMAVVGGNIYVIGGLFTGTSVEMWTAEAGQFSLLSWKLPVKKYDCSSLVDGKNILLSPGSSVEPSSEVDPKLQPPGQEADDTLVIIATDTENIITIKLPVHRNYDIGSQAAIVCR